MTKTNLPPGIWDRPQPEEQNVYNEFVVAWSLDDSAYLKHYEEWAKSQDFIDVAALSYDACGDLCEQTGSMTGDVITCQPYGEIDKMGSSYGLPCIMLDDPCPPEIDDSHCGSFVFGFTTALPLTQPDVLSAQGLTTSHYAWVKFNADCLPDNVQLNYARLKFWPGQDQPLVGGIEENQQDICISEGTNLPDEEDCTNEESWGDPMPDHGETITKSTITTWNVGTPVYSDNIKCVVEADPQGSDGRIVIVVGVADTLLGGSNEGFYASNVELLLYVEFPTSGVKVGGQAENFVTGIFDEYGSGGVVVNGTDINTMRHTPAISGGVKVRPVAPLDVFYTATGGVIVQRADVELHLECNTSDPIIVEDVSSHERDATMVNMDEDNFVDGRIANNKYLDFEIE
jgi:hypothetical protein